MSPMSRKPEVDAPRLLPALVAIAALIVLAGLTSLHTGAAEPAGASITHIL